MNGQDPELEPPGWSELGYGLYQGAIFAIAILLGTMFLLLSVWGGLELYQILFKYNLQ